MDSEVVNVIIAVAVIYFVVKWATGQSAILPSITYMLTLISILLCIKLFWLLVLI